VLVSDPNTSADLALDPSADPTADELASDANGQWINGAIHNNDTLTVGASDPGGICTLSVYMWNGAWGIFNNNNAVPNTPFNPGDANDALGSGGQNGQFTSMTCGATSRSLTFVSGWENANYGLGQLPSGCYYIDAVAQNPAQYVSGQYSSVLNNATICVDTTAPTATISSQADQSTWYATPQEITVNASEPYSGVQDVVCTGGGIGTQTFTSLPATFTVSQVGRDTVTCTPVSNVGTTGDSVSYTVNIDTQTPNVAFSGAQSAPAWLTGSPVVGAAGGETIAASGIASVSCSAANQTTGQQFGAGNGSGADTSFALRADGEYHVTCTATTVAGLSGSASENLQVDNQLPTVTFAGAAPAPAWNNGSPNVLAAGSEAVPLSGIRSTSCSVDGRPPTSGAGAVGDTAQVIGDGPHIVTCSSISGSGVQGPPSSETIQVDDSTPTLSYSDGPSQTAWYRSAQSITVSASNPGGSGISAIQCSVDGTTKTYPNSGSTDAAAESQTVTVDPPGGNLVCNALNGAGSWSGTHAWTFEIDAQPPSGYFLPQDPNNPTVVELQLADDPSGIASVTIELDGNALPTTYNATNGIAVASVPDNGSIADGTHTLAAVVTDVAGNSATITHAVDLQSASLTLPLRVVTQLSAVLTAAGQPQVAATAQIASASKPTPRRRWLRLRFREPGHVRGRLITADGNPVAHANIVIVDTVPAGAAPSRQVGSATTDRRGDWSWTIPPGPTRAFTFLYQGTAVMRTSSATAAVHVAGHQLLEVPKRLIAGTVMRIRGRVEGGWIPSGGVLVQLWYRVRGQLGGWSPFAHVIHTDRHGRWRIAIPITARSKGYVYEFRAVSVQQAGWPYLGASSPVVTRQVR
jgi:hypothetical protein